jgi:hypothetical protein
MSPRDDVVVSWALFVAVHQQPPLPCQLCVLVAWWARDTMWCGVVVDVEETLLSRFKVRHHMMSDFEPT